MNIAPGEFFKQFSTELYNVGQRYSHPDGRVFRFAKAGASNLARGKLCVAPTVVANHINLSWQTAPAIGDMDVFITLGATAATADQYKGGQLVVQDGTGEGRSYPIAGNDAGLSAGTIHLYLKEAIDTAGVLSETGCDLLANNWRGAVISVTDQADYAIGVPVVAITAANFGFLQTGGPCSVLMDEAITNGLEVTIGTGVAGAVEAHDAAGEQTVGVMSGTAGVDTEYQSVELTIDRPFA